MTRKKKYYANRIQPNSMGPSDLIIFMSAVLVQNWKYIIIIIKSDEGLV